MKPLRHLLLALFLLSPLATAACSDEATCESLCSEAQAGSCTNISGDCGAFCGALLEVEGPAGCSSQYDAYQDCLQRGSNVCDVNCGGEEGALSLCVGAFCLGNAADPNCQTLVAGLQ